MTGLVGMDGREIGGNGVSLTERQRQKALSMNCTVGEADEIAHARAVEAVNHLGNQIPPLMHRIVAEAIQGFYESLKERGLLNEPKAASSEGAPNVPTDSEGDE